MKVHTIILRALDLITVVVPPALPATLSIGTSFAISRLRKNGIFCISPNRVNVGGKVNVACFDKTGTLTEDGLDILGVRVPERTDQFGELVTDVHDLPLGSGKATFLYALATCHGLKVVNGEPLGDPLDAKMFGFTGWAIQEGPLIGPKPSTKLGAERPSALVQVVVRPDGASQFKLEDALRAGRVSASCFAGELLLMTETARAFLGIGRDQDLRLCLGAATYERHREAIEKHIHGDLREGCTRGYGRHLRGRFLCVLGHCLPS